MRAFYQNFNVGKYPLKRFAQNKSMLAGLFRGWAEPPKSPLPKLPTNFVLDNHCLIVVGLE